MQTQSGRNARREVPSLGNSVIAETTCWSACIDEGLDEATDARLTRQMSRGTSLPVDAVAIAEGNRARTPRAARTEPLTSTKSRSCRACASFVSIWPANRVSTVSAANVIRKLGMLVAALGLVDEHRRRPPQ